MENTYRPARRAVLKGSLGASVLALGAPAARAEPKPSNSQVIMPADFGAKGDGVADDTFAIQQACSAATLLGAMLEGGGLTYRVTDSIVLPIGIFAAQRMKVDGSDIPLNGLNTTTIISMACPLPVLAGILTSDVAQGAISVAASDITDLAANDWVLIRSEDKMGESESDDGRHARACEFQQVRSVDEGRISFWGALQGTYTVAAEARVEKVQRLGRVDLEDVEFIGCERGLHISEGFESRYQRVSGRFQSTVGVYEDRCYFSFADKWTFEAAAMIADFTAAPYGLQFTGCHNCFYGDIMGWRTRHLLAGGSAGSPKGRSVSRGCTIGDVLAFECFSSPVDQHPGGGFLQVGNLRCTWAPNAGNGGAVQFQGAGGHIASIDNFGHGQADSTVSDVLFDSYGFNDPYFEPTVTVGAIKSRNADHCVRISNCTNRYGNGVSQNLIVNLPALDVLTNDDVFSLNSREGGYDVRVGVGRATSKLGRGLLALNDAGVTAHFVAIGLRLAVLATDKPLIQAASRARVSMVGGDLVAPFGAVPSTVEAGAVVDLTSVMSTNVSFGTSGGGIVNRGGLVP